MKARFPKWCSDNNIQYDLALSNDIDSLLSCALLEKIKGYKINYFYDFNNMYRANKSTNKAIGVDIDLTKGRCWGNHCVLLNKGDSDKSNEQCANLNLIEGFARKDYYSKYCISTVLTIMSFYNYDISSMSEEALMLLLAIDGLHIPYFPQKIDFRSIHKKLLVEILGYKILWEVLQRHTKQEFEHIESKYKLKSTIKLRDNKLETYIDLESISALLGLILKLPTNEFSIHKKYKALELDLNENNFTIKKEDIADSIFSLAVTRKNIIKYSVLV